MTDAALAKQFNGCTSTCGSVCDYIVSLADAEFEATIASLRLIGATLSAHSLEAGRSDRVKAIAARNQLEAQADDGREYERLRALIDMRSYESESWEGWYR